ncbi:hypothetical protein G3T14_23450 [Methylobacterium sp. BTF04]|uniref:hypothetical protein n=1 Tax=Methylobacterium sp. BTF04 TaxID=2708300 RepID=UPI0013D088F5|nr:hypothetical protein [Methylobacterium sp. BTF04]NEU15003.1 hypothetical protein [Methylobacterium sp. BTF04]
MRLPVLLLSAVFALAMTEVGFAQSTLPNDAVNSANDPGTVRDDAPFKGKLMPNHAYINPNDQCEKY